jgi:hypothetical protein
LFSNNNLAPPKKIIFSFYEMSILQYRDNALMEFCF